jgi:hypothetical protein
LGVCLFFGIINFDFHIAWKTKYGYLFWTYFVADKFALLLGADWNDTKICSDEYHFFDYTGYNLFLFGTY